MAGVDAPGAGRGFLRYPRLPSLFTDGTQFLRTSAVRTSGGREGRVHPPPDNLEKPWQADSF
ncbi:hypothetical protein GCM10010503_13770 [Streptomyces lucensis JCM 4490]|uniref:Uncharacterized protein n=1 Tax=Streptomyces lucensis JCM 4490 TaxID=1306176 RepID=A0A918IYV8_9ACTN|nr:hypothetical protein GCM10010503_13770 [Streptomyces lucensis JCM 4490]